jgi:hypothetical protein
VRLALQRSTTGAATLCPCTGRHAECQNGTERENTDFPFHDFLFLNVRTNAPKNGARTNPFLLSFHDAA